ncbi:MLO-like protein 11 [Nymphaea thermarum]|nr:MLO-like protein 11 [Nymphaea thermarum]
MKMGTNYKAALIPHRIRETIHGWGKAARRKRRHGLVADDSTVRTDTSTLHSSEDDEHQPLERDMIGKNLDIELQPSSTMQGSTDESSQNANMSKINEECLESPKNFGDHRWNEEGGERKRGKKKKEKKGSAELRSQETFTIGTLPRRPQAIQPPPVPCSRERHWPNFNPKAILFTRNTVLPKRAKMPFLG